MGASGGSTTGGRTSGGVDCAWRLLATLTWCKLRTLRRTWRNRGRLLGPSPAFLAKLLAVHVRVGLVQAKWHEAHAWKVQSRRGPGHARFMKLLKLGWIPGHVGPGWESVVEGCMMSAGACMMSATVLQW